MRAVAVLSVIAFHFGIFHLTGGFVGVDVFFVISGYLISSIVFSEVAASRFSVIGFYERRIRRIFPAFFAMLLVFALFAAVFFLPAELVDLSKSSLAATFSASNFYFWVYSDYFHNPDPLLHTWSLAVEEQFYILFPIFLVLVRRLFPQWLRVSVVFLFAASLASSVVVVFSSTATAFFMPYTRAWELLLGTMLSLGMFPKMPSLWLRNVAGLHSRDQFRRTEQKKMVSKLSSGRIIEWAVDRSSLLPSQRVSARSPNCVAEIAGVHANRLDQTWPEVQVGGRA